MSSWGSGLLAVAGGIGEGMAGSVRKQAQDERKMSLEEKKQDALLARQKNLARYNADLQAQSRNAQNEWTAGRDGSGFYKDGRELSKAELDSLDESKRKDLMTTGEYKQSVADQDILGKKELLKTKHGFDMELAGSKAAMKASAKKHTPSELKYMQENAMNDLSARLQPKGAMVDFENGTIAIPTDKNGNPDKEILTALDQSGFNFSTGQSFKEDKKGIFTGDNHYLTVHLGGFDPSRINSNEYETPGPGGGNSFDELYGRAKGQTKESTQGQDNSTGNAESQTSQTTQNDGLLAGAGNQAQQLPMDPRTWNVQFMGQGEDRPYITIGNKIKPLSPEEYEAYKQATSRTSSFKEILKSMGAKTEIQ
jgi:hypothetical protein